MIEDPTKIEFNHDFFNLAEELEKECGEWWNAPGLSPEAYSRLMAAVEKLENQKFENRTSGAKKEQAT